MMHEKVSDQFDKIRRRHLDDRYRFIVHQIGCGGPIRVERASQENRRRRFGRAKRMRLSGGTGLLEKCERALFLVIVGRRHPAPRNRAHVPPPQAVDEDVHQGAGRREKHFKRCH